MSLRFLIDEDTHGAALWEAIQQFNATSPDWSIDAIRVGDEGAPALGTLDPDVLEWSVKNGRIIVSLGMSAP